MRDCPDYRDPDDIRRFVHEYFWINPSLIKGDETVWDVSLLTDEDYYELAARIQNHLRSTCPECGEHRPDDDRVLAGMKCGPCSY